MIRQITVVPNGVILAKRESRNVHHAQQQVFELREDDELDSRFARMTAE